ncbi:BglG family transcription antiterminator [Marinilactibacillus psychrotolerans]|uniref:Transcriptional antiterminator n=1 Tax=Marinilactibacillus psychrotolerans TaxID=191770 RepID=A0AAV3WR92_9LACT|nr:PTS sugar transporter subunit IIA [Marinilactibacillus psychrotolerans]GEL66449.1 transcription antiterminator BglG [Marinilactibacillus psychrotolerans]GEQ35265.1 transcriptional antiterminator [Marinilactibacillus psychrotolerans]SDC54775.1 Transcriptional antiterminator [Marinilactibacillus psychrotolerans]
MKDRTLKTLIRLIDSDLPLSMETLKIEFNVSSRTVRNELNEINFFLEREGISRIQNIRGKGFVLKVTNEQKKKILEINDFQNASIYLSRDERIFDLIMSFSLSESYVFCHQKEKEYRISKSTMDEDMRRVRNILQEYGIEVLSTVKQGILLQGSERSIRTMVYDIINRFVGVVALNEKRHSETIIENILYKYIPNNILRKLDTIYDNSISATEESAYRNQLILFTSVWLIRYKLQNTVTGLSTIKGSNKKIEMKAFTNEVCETFGINPPEIELQYINFILDSFSAKDVTKSIEWIQAQMLSIQLIKWVETETNIPFSRKEEVLQEGLYKHILGLIKRVKSDIQIINPLKETIQNYYHAIYQAISKFASNIETVTGKKLTEDEIAFLTIHFSTSVSAIKQDLKYSYKAVIVCNHGMITGKLLSENLREEFNIDTVGVLSSRETDLINKLDVDVVFSTLNIPFKGKPLLVLDPIIKEEDKETIRNFLQENNQFKRMTHNSEDATKLFYSFIDILNESGGRVSKEIYQSLEELFDTHNLKMNKKEIQPMLKDVLKDSDILLSEKAEDWGDAIRRVSIPLLRENIIEERYIDAMIKSVEEYGPYIVIGKNIALAHARPEDGVNKLGVSVATLDRPIAFGNDDNDPVKIIFCLAAVDSYSHLNIMKNLIDLINDEEKINEIMKCKNITEFKEILYSGN